MRDLERAKQPLVKQFMRGQAGDVLALHRDFARRGLQHTGDDVEQGGLARAIRPDQPGDGAFPDRQAGTINGVKTAKMFGESLYGDHERQSPLSAIFVFIGAVI